MRKKVLVVDDHPDFLELATEHIKRVFDVEIVLAKSGNDAIKLIQQHSFALIISDINMSDGNGFDIVSFLENDRKSDAYFIAFTNATLPSIILNRMTVIQKPNYRELISVMQHLEVFNESKRH